MVVSERVSTLFTKVVKEACAGFEERVALRPRLPLEEEGEGWPMA